MRRYMQGEPNHDVQAMLVTAAVFFLVIGLLGLLVSIAHLKSFPVGVEAGIVIHKEHSGKNNYYFYLQNSDGQRGKVRVTSLEYRRVSIGEYWPPFQTTKSS